MKFFISALLTAVLAYTLGLFLPWWSVSIAGLMTGALVPQKRAIALLSSLTGVFILCSSIAFFISFANDHILARKIAVLVLKKEDPFVLILVSGVLGGLVAGVSAFTGRSFAVLFEKK